jgi:multiple sugar transport system permease protein
MLFYLAALQAIPTDVYEAAAVDGTGSWRTFWRITFPLLKPAHFFVLVVFGIGALKIFDQSFIVSGGTGGPVYSTYTAMLYIYNEAFKSANFGVASSAGVVFFAVILLLTMIQRATVGRSEVG